MLICHLEPSHERKLSGYVERENLIQRSAYLCSNLRSWTGAGAWIYEIQSLVAVYVFYKWSSIQKPKTRSFVEPRIMTGLYIRNYNKRT
jgi:hypothetical protein